MIGDKFPSQIQMTLAKRITHNSQKISVTPGQDNNTENQIWVRRCAHKSLYMQQITDHKIYTSTPL